MRILIGYLVFAFSTLLSFLNPCFAQSTFEQRAEAFYEFLAKEGERGDFVEGSVFYMSKNCVPYVYNPPTLLDEIFSVAESIAQVGIDTGRIALIPPAAVVVGGTLATGAAVGICAKPFELGYDLIFGSDEEEPLD